MDKNKMAGETSINEARWLLGSVVFLLIAVFGLGLFADSVSNVQASGSVELVSSK